MVILGSYVAFGTFVSPTGPDQTWTVLWMAQGAAALGTAIAGVMVLRGRPDAEATGVVTVTMWVLLWATMAATVGLPAFANPFTVGTAAFLILALFALLRR